jgi:hypothetical protein
MRMKWVAGAVAAVTLLAAVAPAEAQWGGRYYRGGGNYYRGGGNNAGAVIGGLVAGALIGGAIASSQRGYYGPGPGYGPGYGAPGYGYAPRYAGPPNDVVGYCMSRFKSYDPASGTYLGYDGFRHPCP